jgi:hypothetical protein
MSRLTRCFLVAGCLLIGGLEAPDAFSALAREIATPYGSGESLAGAVEAAEQAPALWVALETLPVTGPVARSDRDS